MPLESIKNFHGHLGPYVVIGYRMGMIANQKLGDDPFCKKARSLTGTTPPISCIIDGVQFSSGCTLGKGNIEVEDKGQPKVIFTNKEGRYIEITLKPDIKARIESEVTEENMESFSEKIFKLPDESLFLIFESDSTDQVKPDREIT